MLALALLCLLPPAAAFCFEAMETSDEADARAFWDLMQRTTGSRSSSWDTFSATFEVCVCGERVCRAWRDSSNSSTAVVKSSAELL